MISTGRRLRKNEFGRYYVTDACDGCGVCSGYAAANFESGFDGTYYFVIQQPYDEAEEDAMRQAMKTCPKHAIRDDGEGY
jgi:ferredoxin